MVVGLGPLADVIADLGIGADVGAGQIFALDRTAAYALVASISRPQRKPSREIFQSYGSVRKFGSMAGGSSGSAVCSVTEPTLLGRRWQVLIVMPWPLMRMRPWSMTNAGRACIWISGDTTSLLERTNMPASQTDAVIGPVR